MGGRTTNPSRPGNYLKPEKPTGGLVSTPILLALGNSSVATKAMMRKFILGELVHNIERHIEEGWDMEILGEER